MGMDELIASGAALEEHCYGDSRYQDVFDTLAAMLRNYSKYSSCQEHYDHPAYKAIVGLGRRAIVLLLEELERNGGWEWMSALEDITGEKPFGEDAAGCYAIQRNAWLEWGRKNDLEKIYKGVGHRFEHNPYPLLPFP